MPVDEGVRWTDREVADALIGKPIPGTNKFQCNTIRTVTLYALSKTQGIHVPKWRDDLRLGAAPNGDGVIVFVSAKEPWKGTLIFDIPRHKLWLNFEHDWPRINYLPEYFTVDPAKQYNVRLGTGEPLMLSGKSLRDGLRMELRAGSQLVIRVEPAA